MRKCLPPLPLFKWWFVLHPVLVVGVIYSSVLLLLYSEGLFVWMVGPGIMVLGLLLCIGNN